MAFVGVDAVADDRSGGGGDDVQYAVREQFGVEDVGCAPGCAASARDERGVGSLVPSFNYVSGNPSNLTPGGAANMADIQGPFTDLRSAINGQLDETNVPNLAAAFTTYKRLHRAVAVLAGPTAAVNLMTLTTAGTNVVVNTAAAATAAYLIELDPTDFNANTRTTKLRIKASLVTNAVAPAQNFTVGLYPIATYGGASSAEPTVASVGTVVAGSTVTFTTPGAGARTPQTGTDFNCPAAGAYILGVLPAGATAGGSVQDVIAFLEMRQV